MHIGECMHCASPWYAPSISAESAADTTGSDALMMWVKETAPAPRETTAPMCVPRWPREMGMRVLTSSALSSGALRRFAAHSSITYGMPMKSCSVAIVYGMGSALSVFLL